MSTSILKRKQCWLASVVKTSTMAAALAAIFTLGQSVHNLKKALVGGIPNVQKLPENCATRSITSGYNCAKNNTSICNTSRAFVSARLRRSNLLLFKEFQNHKYRLIQETAYLHGRQLYFAFFIFISTSRIFPCKLIKC